MLRYDELCLCEMRGVRGGMSSEASSPDRIRWLDTTKGLAMLAIVYGHMFARVSGAYYDQVYWWIYSWHVPIFAVVTGVIYGSHIPALRVQKLPHRIYSMIIPYITFSVIYLAGNLCFAGSSLDWSYQTAINVIELKGCAALWFLPAFMIAQIMVSCSYTAMTKLLSVRACDRFVHMHAHNEAQMRRLLVLMGMGITLFPLYLMAVFKCSYMSHYLLFERSAVLEFWIYIGVLCYQFFTDLPANIMVIGLFGITSCCLSRENGMRELWSANIGNPYLYTAAVFVGSCCIMTVAKLIDRICDARHLFHRIVLFMGSESLMVMGIHQLGLAIVQADIPEGSVPHLAYVALQITSVVVTVGLVYVLSKYWPGLFGKRRLVKERS